MGQANSSDSPSTSENVCDSSQQALEIACDLCIENFDELSRKPRTLTCGHTFCTECISKILSSQNKCSFCLQTLNTAQIEDFPVNYYVLGLLKNNKKSTKKEATEKIQKSHLENRIIEVESLLHAKSQLAESMIKKCNDWKKKIESWKEYINTLPDNSYENFLKSVSEGCDDIQSLGNLEQENGTLYDQDLGKLPSLVKVALAVRRGSLCSAYFDLEGKRRYGKVTEGENSLHVHCLSCIKPNKPTLYIMFQNLQDFEIRRSPTVFLDFLWMENGRENGGRIYIELEPSTLARQFYLLCTGKRGPSYKGANFQFKNNCIEVIEHVHDGKKSKNDIISGINETNKRESYANENFVFGFRDPVCGGTFKIYTEYKKEWLPYKIGVVKAGCEVLKAIKFNGTVEDCGFFIKSGIVPDLKSK